MLPYKTDIDSTRNWQTKNPNGTDNFVYYTFKKAFESTTAFADGNFANRMNSQGKAVTADGDAAKWTAAINVVEDVCSIQLVEATLPWQVAEIGLLTGTAKPGVGGFGMRDELGFFDPNDLPITAGLGVAIAGQSNLVYLHELLHVLGLDHPGDVAGDDPAFVDYTVDSTIMRYLDSPQDVYVEYSNIITPMQYDIALLQQKYGARVYDAGDSGAGSTNTITVTGIGNNAYTLWEGGAANDNRNYDSFMKCVYFSS
jgi:hypothetical protein